MTLRFIYDSGLVAGRCDRVQTGACSGRCPEFTVGMILPTKAMATQEPTVERKLSENTLQIQAASPMGLWVRIPTMALHVTELFDATTEQLYSIFTVKDLVQKFSKSPAVLEAEKGGKFLMFDGNITGEYTELLTKRS
ncbi:activator of 90 kDa heat shock protein ATPase homolog 2-like isoform X2 [Mirounga leonina]|uniref:activator of 90 kDa heat shock protein ATPase homolog 2-like isoform X2 n=1 Tax=Mirounga leonina TaxID=9715 RepID=UPI00156BF40D|nr:activator of 90 kDa heat shock protein ATPase homolog 2-like isoform X2 [Mirounga leonina]XP_034857370.1 activator of 90 kDa heat shock protein ATPase homolog 2-like isoform X2 [Mirounga leonina]